VLTLLATLSLAFVQDSEPIPPTPYDRVIELEITEDDEPAIEGHGPTVIAEYEVLFGGRLHVWTTSDLDLFLRIDDASDARPLASDNDSGGGTTPYLELDVDTGDWLMVLIAGDPGVTGPLALHLAASPETEAGRVAEIVAQDALRESIRLVSEGRRAEAREAMVHALSEVMDTAGPDHPGLLAARANLAGSMFVMGDLAGARALSESVLAGYERILPEDHPELLRARANLAVAMHDMGDLAGARALRESVHSGYERILPADHPDLLRARANLAISVHDVGDLAGARALAESVLAGSERTLPEDHVELLRARSNLAVSIHDMGDLAGARALRESALAGYERILPEDHPEPLLARANLAISMEAMGDLAGARALRESVLAGYDRILPEDHPELLAARGNLARSMNIMGDLAGARALRESVLAGYERTLPEDHPDLLAARASLAVSMEAMGELAGARVLAESVLAGSERILPEDHPELLRAQGHLARSMHASSELVGARALRESVLAGYARILPENHPDLLRARASLMVSMDAMGDLVSARALLPAQIGGMRARILASLALAPRQARQTVASERFRHSEVLFWSESAGSELERSAFELTETMRLVAAEAARSLANFDADPELAPILNEAAEIRRSLNDLVAGATRDETDSKGLSSELTTLSLRRDALERDASRRLGERGVVTEPVGASALRAALGPGDVAIGYRRITLKHVDPSSGELQSAADHLLAHVLDSEGTLIRVDLGPASELEQLAAGWRTALGAPIRGHEGLDSVETPFETGTSVADASRGIALRLESGGNATEAVEMDAGRILRKRILDPVLADVKSDVTRLFVCADDILFLLPLDAFPFDAEGDGSTRVGDRLQVVNGVSFARLLAPLVPNDGKPSLLSMGGVDYDAPGSVPEGLSRASAPIESDAISESGDRTIRSASGGGFQNLVQARHEAEGIAALFEKAFATPPALLTRKKTTKAALFESAPGKRYVHLATHGWFAPESVRSTEDARPEGSGGARMGIEERVSGLAPMTLCGLALAGANNGRDSLGRVPGILTAEELCSLDLSQCELAVLSACETNVGIRRAGQGIQSLQSALYAAGARTSITSLWKVDDAATRRLMEVFYTNLWIEKMPKAEALWQAKQALRNEGHPPAHWAGWVLTGDPD